MYNTCNTGLGFGRCGCGNGCGGCNRNNGCSQRVCRDCCGNLRIQNTATACNCGNNGWGFWSWLNDLFGCGTSTTNNGCNTCGCGCGTATANSRCSNCGCGCGTATANNGNGNYGYGNRCGCCNRGGNTTTTSDGYYARQYGYGNRCGCCSAYDHYVNAYTTTTTGDDA